MPRESYSHNESWNRIRRLFITGSATYSYAAGDLDGEHESWNQALSDVAQLLNNTYPDKAPQVPNAIKATVAEAEAGTDNTKAVTPLGLNEAMGAVVSGLVEHGHMWVSTGTVSQDLSTTWSKPTGIFTDNGVSSTNVTPTFGSDLIDVDLPGTYLVGIQVSAFDQDANYTLKGAAYIDGTRQDGIMFEQYMPTGSAETCSAIGTVSVTGSNSELELYLLADNGTPNIKISTASLMIIGIPAI